MKRIINHLGFNFVIEDNSHMGNPDTPKGSIVLWAFSAWFKVNNGQWIRLNNITTGEFANKIITFNNVELLKTYLKQFEYNN